MSSRQYQRSAHVYGVRLSLTHLSHVSSELQEWMGIRNSHQSSFCPVTTAKMHILFLLHTYLYIHTHVYVCRYLYIHFLQVHGRWKWTPHSRPALQWQRAENEISRRLENTRNEKIPQPLFKLLLPLCIKIKMESSFWTSYYFLICRSAKAWYLVQNMYFVSAANA